MSKLQIYSNEMKGGERKCFKMSLHITMLSRKEKREKIHSLIWDMKIYSFNNFLLLGAENFFSVGIFGIPLNYKIPSFHFDNNKDKSLWLMYFNVEGLAEKC